MTKLPGLIWDFAVIIRKYNISVRKLVSLLFWGTFLHYMEEGIRRFGIIWNLSFLLSFLKYGTNVEVPLVAKHSHHSHSIFSVKCGKA